MGEARPGGVPARGRVSWSSGAGAVALGLVAFLFLTGSGVRSAPDPAAAATQQPSGTRPAAVTDPPATSSSERSATASPDRVGPTGPAGTVPPAARPDPERMRRDAESALRSYLVLSDRTYQAADGKLAGGLAEVAAGFALGEVSATAIELQSAGARQTGTVGVAWLAVDAVDLAAAPPTVTIRACLDTSRIDILALDGSSTRQGRQPTVRRTLHVFGVQYAGAWRVTTHSFPDQADCQ